MRARTTQLNLELARTTLAEAAAKADDDIFDDEQGLTDACDDDETAFDDVAMILLLFFMVTSLLVVISPEPESPTRGQAPLTTERADPAALFKGVTHRLLITPGPAGGVNMILAGVGPARDEPQVTKGPFFMSGSEAIEDDYPLFKEAFRELLDDSKVPSASSETAPKPVYLVNHFGHKEGNDLVLSTWYALAAVAKDKSMKHITKKVRFTRWRAQVRE
jgi:hypothetical protein